MNFFSLVAGILLVQFVFAQPGKYAGTKKSLIGKQYADNRNIPGLKGWQYRGGSLLTAVDDLEVMTADVFKNSTTYLVLFSIKEDSADTKFTIADVIEIKNIPSSQHIRTGLCLEGANEAADIVALVRKENTEFSRAIKAWRLNRDKRRVQSVNPKLVKCMNEVD